MDVEQRARELPPLPMHKGLLTLHNTGGVSQFCGYTEKQMVEYATAAIAALTPPEGSDQSLLELAATFETCIPFLPSTGQRNIGKAVAQLRHMAMGYVLVPVEPTSAMQDAVESMKLPHALLRTGVRLADFRERYAAMLAACSEVHP